ncbi:MAG: malate synthase G [Cellvibrionaceae bacterium]
MTAYIEKSGLRVAAALDELMTNDIIPGLDIDSEKVWQGFSELVHELAPKNADLLKKRDAIQRQLDEWHRSNPELINDMAAYKKFLAEIGYLVPEGEDFSVTTENVDEEIAQIAGPQLVVPVNNARFSLNAANARWGSLYDALYGTDTIPEDAGYERGNSFNERRGVRVIAKAAGFLDTAIPLSGGHSHSDVAEYQLSQSAPVKLTAKLINGEEATLATAEQFVAYVGEVDAPTTLLFKNNGLHIEVHINRDHPIGKNSPSGVKDVVIESAISTIQDCEDSVAAVDAEDKALVYKNWLGLMKGTLSETFVKSGKNLTRKLNADRHYTGVNGDDVKLHGRSLLLVRNVGHLMTTNAILDKDGNNIPEGFMDALFTTLCAMHDFKENTSSSDQQLHNSRTKSIYIVKPKMHGPEEVAFTNELFARIEDVLGLPRHTMKVGVMDEERRTTVNLKECIRAAKERLVFINTGFLDRTGDEMHTSMEAGPMLPKEIIKQQAWIGAYENWNVDIGLECGLPGHAQIGKGMWPKPDEMSQMMAAKIAHPEAGANCAWVPSPTAATLHAMHYHHIDVKVQQATLRSRTRANIDDILTPPLLGDRRLTSDEIQEELDNNAQGILGYVVRWIDQGVGCSKVPDINNVGLMEDRATLRISSQHIANWLRHGICTKNQVMETMKRMARIVDEQNAGDAAYQAMAPSFGGVAFESACALVFEGCAQPSGYTEPLLHAYREKAKTEKSPLQKTA